MMTRPLVSIITPTYNCGRYLKECIESVLAQDYPNIEHVIQDGASTDNSIKILKKYSSQKYRRKIKWISEPDDGQVDGLNRAIQRSKGEIILVLNADDALLPDACSWAVKQMSRYRKAAVVYGDQYIVNAKSNITGIGVTGEFNFEKFLCVEQYMATQAAFIRRSMFEKVGLYADTSLETMPDYEMWLRISAKYPMQYIPKIITRYRIYPHMDGKNPRSAKRFIKAKSTVLEGILQSPKTQIGIKRLRKRAYAGMYLWVAEEMINIGNLKDFFWYLAKAIITYPKKTTFNRAKLLLDEKFIRKHQVTPKLWIKIL